MLATCIPPTAAFPPPTAASAPPRQWQTMHLHATRLILRVPEGDPRVPTLRLLLSTLRSCERARRAGRGAVEAALWESCCLLACRMAGRWSL